MMRSVKFASWLAGLLIGAALVAAAPVGAQTPQQCVTNAVAGGTSDAITVPLLPCGLSTNILILTITANNTTTTPTLQMAGFPAQRIYTNTLDNPGIGDFGDAGSVLMLTSTGTSWLVINGNVGGYIPIPLTVPDGGTGATTLTANGLVYGNGVGTVGVTAEGATGEFLIGSTGNPPEWASISSSLVSSISFASTGLTPASPTGGAVTVGGTLGFANGGTGQTSYTNGQLLIGNTGTGGLSKATLTAGANTIITNGGGTITIASTGVSSGCGTIGSIGQVLVDNGAGGCSSISSGTLGQVLTSAGAGVPPTWENGTAYITWGGVQAANFNAAANTGYCVDTTGGAVTMTLPASPADGDKVQFIDCDSYFGTTSMVVDRNGNTVMGLAENMTVNTVNASAVLVYVAANNDWRMF